MIVHPELGYSHVMFFGNLADILNETGHNVVSHHFLRNIYILLVEKKIRTIQWVVAHFGNRCYGYS